MPPTSSPPKKLLPRVVVALLASPLLLGCGNTIYLMKVNSAEERFIQAKQMGAEQLAPFEYYGAQVRLNESKRQAAEGEYGNAAKLAEESDELSFRATQKIRERRSKTGGAK